MTETDYDNLARDLIAGNRRALSRAITLVESSRADHRAQAGQLLQQLAPHAGASIRIGISGVPGVGKSTFIEALGNHILALELRLAVLAVDPSSSISGGSILGDKTRMELLSRRREAFIRPTPASGTLGGVSRRTRETMLLCEAAGFDVILVETVGVGQSETAVADMILINKADGELQASARHSAADYRSALRLIHPRTRDWQVPVKTCSALENEGIVEIWSLVERYRETLSASGEFEERRAAQASSWMWAEISESLLRAFRSDHKVKARLCELESAVTQGSVPPALAASQLLTLFLEAHR